MNETYLPYGVRGSEFSKNQNLQDLNARQFESSGASVERALVKSSLNYANGHWDLVDAGKDGNLRLKEIKTEELPIEMRSMSASERETYVRGKGEARNRFRGEIRELEDKRRSFLMSERGQPTSHQTLDMAVIHAVHEIAEQAGFQFKR